MKVLVVGGGGREHALGWKIRQSNKVKEIFFAPGNSGTLECGENVILDTTNHAEVTTFCKTNSIDLVVIGPDDALAQGITNALQNNNIKVFGPTKEAAKLEWSKSFAKQFMRENGIPTAKYQAFSSSREAIAYASLQSFPLVIKADGLAQGKGVVIAETLESAKAAITEMLDAGKYGEAGSSVLIEEFLTGQEISVHAFCDGTSASLFPSAQDHKRIYEHDKGPNTGGMGTVAPVPGVTAKTFEEIQQRIIEPVLSAMKKDATPFVGVLFPGIILTSEGPKVIEFNARFGDPETQSYMRLLQTDLVEIMLACLDGSLSSISIEWSTDYACCVVAASEGYPEDYKKGIEISGLDRVSSEVVFHAGTKQEGDKIFTSGGRVLGVTAVAPTLPEALTKAYERMSSISFEGMQFRKDIGVKCL